MSISFDIRGVVADNMLIIQKRNRLLLIARRDREDFPVANDTNTDDRSLQEDARTDISVLASAVLSALSDKTDEGSRTIRGSVVHKLIKATLKGGAFNSETLLFDLQDNRLSPDQIVDLYIPQAAHSLGCMWQDDEISFAQVTVATARLQGLLTLLAPPWSFCIEHGGASPSVLLILQSTDCHTLGPHVASAQLRRMGASVRVLFGPDSETVLRILAEEPVDLVMFSSSRTEALAAIAAMVADIRANFCSPPPIALGGIILGLTDRAKDQTGVDLVTGDVRVAFKLCEKTGQKTRSMAC